MNATVGRSGGRRYALHTADSDGSEPTLARGDKAGRFGELGSE